MFRVLDKLQITMFHMLQCLACFTVSHVIMFHMIQSLQMPQYSLH